VPEDGRPSSSWIVLIIANAVPLVGVLALHWTVYSVLLVYWSENVMVGAFNVLRMVWAQPGGVVGLAMKLFMIPFFCLHYGMFTFVHGIFVVSLFGPPHAGQSLALATLVDAVRSAHIGYALIFMLANHLFSFLHDYLGRGEFRRTFLPLLMVQPYTRVMLLHVTILLGGFLVLMLGAPIAALVFLVVLKTGIDLRAHQVERRKLAMPALPVAA
jgi:hypothetical protein